MRWPFMCFFSWLKISITIRIKWEQSLFPDLYEMIDNFAHYVRMIFIFTLSISRNRDIGMDMMKTSTRRWLTLLHQQHSDSDTHYSQLPLSAGARHINSSVKLLNHEYAPKPYLIFGSITCIFLESYSNVNCERYIDLIIVVSNNSDIIVSLLCNLE